MTTTKQWTRGLGAALMLCLAAACSSGGDDADAEVGGSGASGAGGAGGAGTSGAGGAGTGGGTAGSSEPEPPPMGPFYGAFGVKLIAKTAVGIMGTPREARTEVKGTISDGQEPSLRGWEMIDEIGDCALFVPDMPLCDPKCQAGAEICAPGDMCLPVPAKRTAGMVTVEGLGDAPFDLPDTVAGSYQLVGVPLPYPPCAEGDAVTFTIEGDTADPFTLQTGCVATLEGPEPVMIARGTPVELRWAAPTMPELANLHVHLDISHHGGVRGQIECDTADDGELDIDVDLIDGLIGLGLAGFPTIVLTRSTVVSGTGASAENLSLMVSSTYESPVTVEGVISCTDTAQCPDGQICGLDLRCS